MTANQKLRLAAKVVRAHNLNALSATLYVDPVSVLIADTVLPSSCTNPVVTEWTTGERPSRIWKGTLDGITISACEYRSTP